MYYLFPWQFIPWQVGGDPNYYENHYYEGQLCRIRQYPPIDTSMLSESISEYQILMKQGELLLNRLRDSLYAKKVMEAAQHGNKAEVDDLIESISGLYVPIQTKYTPSGAIFQLQSPAVAKGGNCCTLNITLKWGK